jgi:uncharacterized protein
MRAPIRWGVTPSHCTDPDLLPDPDRRARTITIRGRGATLPVFVDAIARHDPRARQLWFDVTTVTRNASPDALKQIAARIRQLGVKRVLFGSDAAGGDNLAPRESWADFQKLPLTEAEFRIIANNVAPYMR